MPSDLTIPDVRDELHAISNRLARINPPLSKQLARLANELNRRPPRRLRRGDAPLAGSGVR